MMTREREVMTVFIGGSPDPELDQQAARQVENDRYKVLAAAVLKQAVTDARYRLPKKPNTDQARERLRRARDARQWLQSPDAQIYLDCCGIHPDSVAGWLDRLPELTDEKDKQT